MNLAKRIMLRATGLALVLTGVALVAAGPASANDRTVSVLCTDKAAGTWRVSVTFSSIEVKADRPVTVTLGPKSVTLTEVGPNGTVTLSQDFPGDQETADLIWSVVRLDYQNTGKLHLDQPEGCRSTTTTTSTTSTTSTTVPTTTVPPATVPPATPPAKSLRISAAPLCRNDTPYVQYRVTPVGFVPKNNVTIRWKTPGGRVAQQLTNQPFSGTLLWPGVVLSGGQPVDWPGWDQRADGTWFEVPTDLRPSMTVEFSVNPTSAVTVAYPPATPTCHPSPTNSHQVKSAHALPALPVTGGPSVPLLAFGGAAVVAGLALVRTSRRRPQQA